MEAFIPYMIKSSSILLVLFVYYQFFLKKQTFFNLNRIYLLSALLIAVCVPYISIEIAHVTEETSTVKPKIITYMGYLLDEVNVFGNYNTNTSEVPANTFNFLWIIYWSGVLFFGLRNLIAFYQIHKLIRRNPDKYFHGIHFIQLRETQSVFSFFNYLFVPVSLEKRENKRKIFEHEKIHIRQLHSLDLCITEIICIFNWFNPLVWLYKDAITENHEYIADHQVIRRFHTGSYLELLVQQTFKGAFSFTNYFSCSNLKKRTIMMTKKQSRKYRVINYLPALVLVSILFYGFTYTNPIYTIPEAPAQEETDELIPLSRDTNTTIIPVTQSENNEVFIVVENMPKFNGNMTEWIMQNVRYPYDAMIQNIQGKVFVQFIIDKEGNVTHPKVVKGVNPLLDEEALRVISVMPKWQPGTQRGKVVRVSYTLPINFALSTDEKVIDVPDTPQSTPDDVFIVVENMPQFSQGNTHEWIAKNIKYPAGAIEKKIEGKVYIQFVIEKDGSLSNFKIIRGADPILDQEALRVVKQMPNWKPGKQRGKAVRVAYTLPVSFKLSK